MSCPSSPLLASSEAALVAAASEVAENSLFAFVDSSDLDAFRVSTDAAWTIARVGLTGPTRGEFQVTAPEALMRTLCAAFIGTDASEEISAGAVMDFAGELANMICGAWLTRVVPHASFDLTAPLVVRRDGHHVHQEPASDTDSSTCYVSIDESPVRLRILGGPVAVVAGHGVPDAR